MADRNGPSCTWFTSWLLFIVVLPALYKHQFLILGTWYLNTLEFSD